MDFRRDESDEFGSNVTRERAENDWYKTPPGAVDRLFAKLRWMREKQDGVPGDIWEPAAGDGSMGMEIAGNVKGYSVLMSDIDPKPGLMEEYGFRVFKNDFLYNPGYYENVMGEKPAMIITNPPFKGIEEWILTAIRTVRPGGLVCLLAKLQLLEGKRRYEEIFREYRPRLVLVFPERLSMWREGVKPEGTGKTAYAWFVWDTMWFTEEFRKKRDFSPWTQVQWLEELPEGPGHDGIMEGF